MTRRFLSLLHTWAIVALPFIASSAPAAVYEVGPDGSLMDILGGVTVTLADGDAVYVSGNAGTAGDVSTSFTLDKSITLYGDGPGVSIITNSSAGPIPFLRAEASLHLRGLTLSGFSDAIELDPPGGLDPDPGIVFEAHHVAIENGNRGIIALWQGPLGSGVIASARIKNCRFTHLDDAAIYLQTRKLLEADVAGNHIETVGLVGIWLGDDGPEDDIDDYSKNFIVSGNHIADVAEVGVGQFQRNFGIAIFGREAVVRGNVIRDLNRGVDSTGGGDSYAGIYTKAAYVVIAENIIRDPGPGYAITLKGRSRHLDRSDPPGYSSIIANNQIFISPHFIFEDSGSMEDGPITARLHSGIKTNAEDVTILGNHIENASQEAILVQIHARDDVSVIGNTAILGKRSRGLGYGVLVQTYLVPTPDDPSPLPAADRRILATNNRFVGIVPCSTIVDRRYNGTSWSTTNPPTGPGEWVVGHNIPALPSSGC